MDKNLSHRINDEGDLRKGIVIKVISIFLKSQ